MSGPGRAVCRRGLAAWHFACHAAVTLPAVALMLTVATAPAAAGELDGPGPFAASTRKLAAWPLSPRAAANVAAKAVADLYCPEPGRRSREVRTRPLAIILPDQADRPEHVAGTATHLASHGIVVAVPHWSSADAAGRASEIVTLRRALDQRSGQVRTEPLLQCLAQQELGRTIVVAHGRAASVVLQLEQQQAKPGAPSPAVVWLSPTLEPAELGIRTPATQASGGSDEAEEHLPGRSPAELLLLPSESRCSAGTQSFFAQTQRLRARFTVTIDPAVHCDFVEPGNPACAQRCGASDSSSRARARRVLTGWLRELSAQPSPAPGELADALAQWVDPDDIEQRPLAEQPVPLQAGLSLLMGAGLGLQGEGLPGHGFAIGARPALIYGRQEDGFVGVGPYAEVLTQGLDDVVLGGGLELVMPIYGSLAIAPSGGMTGWYREGLGWDPAVSVGGFIGTRAGHSGSFLDPACGVRVDGRIGVGERSERALLILFQGDVISAAAYLAMAIAWAT